MSHIEMVPKHWIVVGITDADAMKGITTAHRISRTFAVLEAANQWADLARKAFTRHPGSVQVQTVWTTKVKGVL